jgi:hypothetical protein
MTTRDAEQLSRGLLSHLHLSAAQAAVVLDVTSTPERLVVFLYDPTAARSNLAVKMWCGHPVELRRVSVEPH